MGNGSVAGALVVDGGLYSPGIPKALRKLKPPAVGTGMKELNVYQELIAERKRYALRRLGATPVAGTIRYQCPAAAGRVGCPIRPQSLSVKTSKGVIVPTNVPSPGARGDICTQTTITIDVDDPLAQKREMGYVGGLYQKHPFGSDAHYDSMRRRAYVEGAFGNIKNEAEQSLRRPSIRVMGRAKMTLAATLVVTAANLRMGRNWTLRRERAAGGPNGPVISPAMAAAAKAHTSALSRRRRRESGRERVPASTSSSVKVRSKPGSGRSRPPRDGPPG